MAYKQEMTARTQKLYDNLLKRAQGDRSKEWFTNDMFGDFFDESNVNPLDYGLDGNLAQKTVLLRRAVAIDVMLKAMTNPDHSKYTKTAEIQEGDLLLGVLPMGSNGLGKVFPQFMTEDELRAGSITNRNTGSLFGHNTIDYSELLRNGLEKKVIECREKIEEYDKREKRLERKIGLLESDDITDQTTEASTDIYANKTNKDFYIAVKIACQSVIDYAKRFADIAEKEAENKKHNAKRRAELKEMARIARKVPLKPADTFHEAVQSITFFHIALHASMNLISLGRLDQVLKPYVAKLTKSERPRALEIMECFLIKLAWRLNLSSDYLYQQDHVDYSTVLGTHAYYIDQKAGVNNFLQNIIIGGKTPRGKDATNEATYLILQAFTNVNLSTPGIYVRLSKGSPNKLVKAVANSINKTRNNPAIINDDVMIPAIHSALMQDTLKESETHKWETDKSYKMMRLANDFVVDGCWEPILNGCSDWTFTMPNLMVPMETSLNQGASLSPDPELFRGAKIAPYVPLPESFDELIDTFKSQLGFFVDQCVLSMFLYYMIDEYAAPSPLLSAYLKGCMEKGRDKAWAGANYNLAGIIFGGFPDVLNNMLAIRKWVFPADGKGKYTLSTVADAFRNNYICADVTNKALQNTYDSIRIDFDTNSPKFGDNEREVTSLARRLLDICYDTVMDSARFAKKVYQDKPKPDEWKNIIALRRLTGYYGPAMSAKFKDFKMKVTVGLGTFEQYNWSGRGISASADRRSGEPIAPNFTPSPGTAYRGAAGLLSSFENLGLDRFAGGVITDICLDDSHGVDAAVIERLIGLGINNNAGMFTISIGSRELFKEIYEKAQAAASMTNKEDARKLLEPYAGVNVRIGGWQTPFVTLPVSHMENYINRPADANFRRI